MRNGKKKQVKTEQWALFRFSVVGPLLAAPADSGELQGRLVALSEQTFAHPLTGEPVRFGVSTIERWYYQAKRTTDPVGALRRKVRRDRGSELALTDEDKRMLVAQYRQHRSWSAKLHYDNFVVVIGAGKRGAVPSYATVLRFLRRRGLERMKRQRRFSKDGEKADSKAFERREVRSYEVSHVHGLWHLDFHHGSQPVLLRSGEWVTPLCLAVIDDRSRLCCHLQWYLSETAENLVHCLCQAFLKRGLPRRLMSDNGAAMLAQETRQGLERLGIIHETTLPNSPYQNGKQEAFWGPVEGRLIAMTEGKKDLSLSLLNRASMAWVEEEYHRARHSETGEPPIDRVLAGPSVGRAAPDATHLAQAFTIQQSRSVRKSDGTLSIEGRRFEIAGRFRHLDEVTIRFARWDLALVYLVDPTTGVIIDRLYPLDRARNADGRRRRLPDIVEPVLCQPASTASGLAPLLEELISRAERSGLPPAYLPKDDLETDGEERS
jgi:transposase InsO family protein